MQQQFAYGVNDSVAAYLLDSKVSWGPVPDQRYQTATELADAAHHALTEGPTIHAPDTASQWWGARAQPIGGVCEGWVTSR